MTGASITKKNSIVVILIDSTEQTNVSDRFDLSMLALDSKHIYGK